MREEATAPPRRGRSAWRGRPVHRAQIPLWARNAISGLRRALFNQPDIDIADLAQVLAFFLAFIKAQDKDDLEDVKRHAVQRNAQPFVVAVARACTAVAQMADCTTQRFRLVIEHKIIIIAGLIAAPKQKGADIRIWCLALKGVGIPAYADMNFIDGGNLSIDIDFITQIDAVVLDLDRFTLKPRIENIVHRFVPSSQSSPKPKARSISAWPGKYSL
ncbi:MAG: hypothetical protein L6Q57_02890 [Alphaproteobacteria bacterium]|nr:hypothetical protein [Alphaproteobacteria bacterium]